MERKINNTLRITLTQREEHYHISYNREKKQIRYY